MGKKEPVSWCLTAATMTTSMTMVTMTAVRTRMIIIFTVIFILLLIDEFPWTTPITSTTKIAQQSSSTEDDIFVGRKNRLPRLLYADAFSVASSFAATSASASFTRHFPQILVRRNHCKNNCLLGGSSSSATSSQNYHNNAHTTNSILSCGTIRRKEIISCFLSKGNDDNNINNEQAKGLNEDNGKNGELEAEGGGYRFGDISRGLVKGLEESVNSITGKEGSYEFGDISRWLDQQAKSKAMEFTNKSTYEFGDISKELVRRIREGDYTEEDLWLLLKLVISIGIQFPPLAKLLPLKVLVQLLNLSMSQQLSERIQHVLTQELDKRVREMFLSKTGETTQAVTKKAILKFTGRDDYSVGDITKRFAPSTSSSASTTASSQSTASSSTDDGNGNLPAKFIELTSQVVKELEEWDKKHLN